MWLLIKSKLELGTEQEYRIIEYYVPYCNKKLSNCRWSCWKYVMLNGTMFLSFVNCWVSHAEKNLQWIKFLCCSYLF